MTGVDTQVNRGTIVHRISSPSCTTPPGNLLMFASGPRSAQYTMVHYFLYLG